MEHVLDIPENDVIMALKVVVSQHRNNNDGSMQVDADTDTGPPTLPHFLSACVKYAMSPAALRLALHDHLREGEDIVCVLEVIESWISEHAASLPTPTSDDTLPPLPKVRPRYLEFSFTYKKFFPIGAIVLTNHSRFVPAISFAIPTISPCPRETAVAATTRA